MAADNQQFDKSSSFFFFSSILDRPIVERETGRTLGRASDLTAGLDDAYPRIREVVGTSGRRGQTFAIGWDRIVSVGARGLQVTIDPGTPPPPYRPREGDILLREHFLDRQIVDIAGCKIVRVNDLHLLRTNGSLWLVHMDVGTRGLFRRLGFESGATALIRWLFSYELPHKFISWKYVQPIPSGLPANLSSMKLTIPQKRLVELHPADLADIIEELNARDRRAVLDSLPVEKAAEALEEAEPEVQKSVIEEIHEEKAADILEEMSPTEAADILGDLTEEKAENILDAMEPGQAEDVRELLEHHDDSAGGLMTTSYVSVASDMSVAAALDHVRAIAPEADVITYLYVVDSQEHLLGVVTLRELLCAKPSATMSEIQTTKIVSVTADMSPKEVARLFAKYGFRAIPVLDVEGKLQGVIRFRNVIQAVAPYLEG